METVVVPLSSGANRLIVKPKSEVPKSKVPNSRPKGLGLTLKSHGPPHHPPHPPLTFKHEGVLWQKSAKK